MFRYGPPTHPPTHLPTHPFTYLPTTVAHPNRRLSLYSPTHQPTHPPTHPPTPNRDQQFSADMGSAAVKRIEDVRVLRARQFAEDSGPRAHAIRPESYMKMDNFYTSTVYEKGAEVIRMYVSYPPTHPPISLAFLHLPTD